MHPIHYGIGVVMYWSANPTIFPIQEQIILIPIDKLHTQQML